MKKICIICSSGGHLEEVKQLNKVIEKYNCYFVTTRTGATIKDKNYKYLIEDFDRKNIIKFFIKLIYMFIEQKKIFKLENPDIILTTGAGLVLPTCFFAKLHRKKIIYIESYARIKKLSKTGLLMYKFADKFIVQREELFSKYPKSIYGGVIF